MALRYGNILVGKPVFDEHEQAILEKKQCTAIQLEEDRRQIQSLSDNFDELITRVRDLKDNRKHMGIDFDPIMKQIADARDDCIKLVKSVVDF